jgi:AcrR family transcriptional regulator
MLDVAVIDEPAAAMAVLDPLKARLLAELSTPASAAALAARLGVARQKVNYHLRGLEEQQLVRHVDDRRWGGLTERLLVATAASYIVSPAALGPVASDPKRHGDRLSASYVIALAARIVREVGALWKNARARDTSLATLAIDTVIGFRTPAERTAFADDLAAAVTTLAKRYHTDPGPDTRTYRLVVASYPAPATRRA